MMKLFQLYPTQLLVAVILHVLWYLFMSSRYSWGLHIQAAGRLGFSWHKLWCVQICHQQTARFISVPAVFNSLVCIQATSTLKLLLDGDFLCLRSCEYWRRFQVMLCWRSWHARFICHLKLWDLSDVNLQAANHVHFPAVLNTTDCTQDTRCVSVHWSCTWLRIPASQKLWVRVAVLRCYVVWLLLPCQFICKGRRYLGEKKLAYSPVNERCYSH